MFEKLPLNASGRDFVVGDLHGCRPLLDALLEFVSFDPAVDRLLSVGDLVDRGPDSLGCLRLLKEPWFHAVRGNHEVMLLDFVWDTLHHNRPLPRGKRHMFLENGGDWILPCYDPNAFTWYNDALELLQRVSQLPFVLIVGEGKSRYHVVHADLYDPTSPGQVLRDADLDRLAEEWSEFDCNIHPDEHPYFTRRFLWSRAILQDGLTLHVPKFTAGLSPTFCGHTIGKAVRTVRSHIDVDTGAFLAYQCTDESKDFGLTVFDVTNRQGYFATPSDDDTIEIRVTVFECAWELK